MPVTAQIKCSKAIIQTSHCPIKEFYIVIWFSSCRDYYIWNPTLPGNKTISVKVTNQAKNTRVVQPSFPVSYVHKFMSYDRTHKQTNRNYNFMYINTSLGTQLCHETKFSFFKSTQINYQVQLGGNRDKDQLYMTSQVSNITRKTTFSPISWHVFQD